MKATRRINLKNATFCCALTFAAFFIAFGEQFLSPLTLFYINLTPSQREGVYLRDEIDSLCVGDLVIIKTPERIRLVLASFGINPTKTLLKNILAGPGDVILVDLSGAYVNGFFVGPVKRVGLNAFAKAGLTRIPFEKTLAAGEYFAGTSNPDSIDSRYFGPVSRSEILSKASLLVGF